MAGAPPFMASDFLERKLLDKVFRGDSYQPTMANCYIGLLKSSITDNMSGVGIATAEANYTGYDRIALGVAFLSPADLVGGYGHTDNNQELNFLEVGSGDGTQNFVGWFITSGNNKNNTDQLLYWGQFTVATATVRILETPSFLTGNLNVYAD